MKIQEKFIVLGLLFFASTQAAFASYSDINEQSTYYRSVSYLELQGATDNSNSFRPDDLINKAELFKILFKIFAETPQALDPRSQFTDVNKSDWYAGYAQLAVKYGIIDKSEIEFAASTAVSKVDAMDYLYKIYGISAARLTRDEKENLFKDVSADHPYNTFIKKAVDLEIIESSTAKKFEPYKKITRGEFADLLFKFDQWYTNESGGKIQTISSIHKADILASIWDKILGSFYLKDGEKIDEEALYQAAIKGMVASLNDPYSTFLSGNSSTELTDTLSGDFEGIGVYLMEDEITKKIHITDFVPGTNASEVGLLVGDQIEEVNDEDIAGLSYAEIVKKIKGPAGTTVKLKVRRGTQSFTYEVQRRALKLVLQTGKIIYDDVWYIDINLFTDVSYVDVNIIMKDLASQVANPKAIVIDLRSNSGGYLNSAISIAGHFIPNNQTIVQLDYGSFIEEIQNGGSGEYVDIPLYVLIDKYSASASEILAAALNEAADAVLIGQKSFGKGTAQQINQYWDGSILKLTIAQWLTPDGNTIQGFGLEPDIKITQSSKTVDLWMVEVERLLK